MDEIDIVMKHLKSIKELKPERVAPKAPKKPREPKAPDPEKATPAKQKNYDKRMTAYSEKLKEYNTEFASYKRAFDNWELNESRKKALVSQVKLKEDGTLIGGSPHRAFMLTGFENEMELDYFIGGTGEKYPNMERFFPDLSGDSMLSITEVQAFRKFCQTVAPVAENARVTIESGKWTFYPSPYDRDPAFESASWAIDYDGETVKFGIDPEKLAAMFMLFEKLKVKKADLYFVSPVRPMTFVTDRGKYLICPVRVH